MAALAMIKAFILDFDGVIANSMPLQCQAWEAAMQSVVGELSSTQSNKLLSNFWAGYAGDHIFKDTGLREDLKAHLRETKDKIWRDNYTAIQPISGAIEAIQKIRLNYPVAIATTGERNYVHGLLERFKLTEYIEWVIAREDVTTLKPAPDALLLIANYWNLNPDELIVIGDSASDKGMAEAAGSQFILLNADGRHVSLCHDPIATYSDWPTLLASIQTSLIDKPPKDRLNLLNDLT